MLVATATSTSVEAEQPVLDVAVANGVTQTAIIVVQVVPAPEIEAVDPDDAGPGTTFAIIGHDLVLRSGDEVTVLFLSPLQPNAPPNPDPLAIVTATPTMIQAIVPTLQQEARFSVVVSRSDGAEAPGGDFHLSLL